MASTRGLALLLVACLGATAVGHTSASSRSLEDPASPTPSPAPVGLDGRPCECQKKGPGPCECPQKPYFVPGENDRPSPCELKQNEVYWRSLLRGGKNWPEMGKRKWKEQAPEPDQRWFKNGDKWKYRWYEPKDMGPGGCGGTWEDPEPETTTTTTTTTTYRPTTTTTGTVIVYDPPPPPPVLAPTPAPCDMSESESKDADGADVPPVMIKSPPAPPKNYLKKKKEEWTVAERVDSICACKGKAKCDCDGKPSAKQPSTPTR